MVQSYGRDQVIGLYLKILEEFVGLILQEIFWVEHIPFARMVKFLFLAQFPVDHLTHPVVSIIIIIIISCEFFTPALVDGLSLESE